jgi:transcriptional regulator with XRE-family HTH domain
MGRNPSEKPERLAEKLFQIRSSLNLSQAEMIRKLCLENKLTREDVSKFERGLRLPSLLTLLRYARAANTSVDVLIDDELELFEEIPSRAKKREGKIKK